MSNLKNPEYEESSKLNEDDMSRNFGFLHKEIVISRNAINVFGNTTGDYNPIHRKIERAIALGFRDTPVMGAHLAAHGEQLLEEELAKIKSCFGSKIELLVQKSKFSAPVYPEDKILFQIPTPTMINGEFHLEIEGLVDNKKVFEIIGKAGANYRTMPDFKQTPIFSERHSLHGLDLFNFYDNLRVKQADIIPNAFITAYSPATLLNLLYQRTESMEGTNLSMEFHPLRKIKLEKISSEYQVDVYIQRKPMAVKSKDKNTGQERTDWLYKFQTQTSEVVKDAGLIPTTFGEVVCLAPRNLNIDPIKN